MQKEKLVSRNFLVMLPIGFCIISNFLLIYISIARYATDIFGATSTLAGLAASIFIFGSFVSRLLLARSIEIMGMKRILVAASLLGAAICLVYPLAHEYWALLLIRFAHGTVYGICLLTANTLVAKIVPASRRGEGMGYYMLAFTLASAIAPFLSMSLVGHGDFKDLFYVGSAFYIVACLSSLLLTVPRESFTEEQRKAAKKFTKDNILDVSALRISAIALIFFFAYSSVLTFISQYGTYVGIPEAAYFFLMIAASTFLSRVFIGKIFDRHGENILFIPVFIAFIAGLLIISNVHNGSELLFAGFLIGFGVALVNSTGQAIVIRDCKSERYPVALSTFSMAMDMSYMIGPFTMGFLASLLGYRGMYLAAAIIGVFGLIAYIFLHGNRVRKKSQIE